MNYKFLLSLVVLGIVVSVFFLLFPWQKAQVVKDFDSCAGSGVIDPEAYPSKCSIGSKQFTQDVGNEIEKIDLIRIDWPRPGGTVQTDKPLIVDGNARESWFHNGSFPIIIKDDTGTVIASAPAVAQSFKEMEGFISYKATLVFSGAAKTDKGTLILEAANPSGDASKANAMVLPLKFE